MNLQWVICNAQQYQIWDLWWRRFKVNDNCDLRKQSYNTSAKLYLRGDTKLLVKTAICFHPVIFMWPFISTKIMFYSIVKLWHPSHTHTHTHRERQCIQLKSKVIILQWWQHCLKMTLDCNVVQVNFSVWKDLWKDNAGPIYTQLKCVFPFESAPIPSWPSEQLELNMGCYAEKISIVLLRSHLKSTAWTIWPSESWLLCKGESINVIFRFHKHNYATVVQRFQHAHVSCMACLPCNVINVQSSAKNI